MYNFLFQQVNIEVNLKILQAYTFLKLFFHETFLDKNKIEKNKIYQF